MKHSIGVALVFFCSFAALAGTRFIDVSAKCPRYFETAGGKPWIPVGCNICFIHLGEASDLSFDHARVRADFDRWIRAFAANGGNCIRLWAGHGSLEVMPEKPGVYDPETTKTIKGIVRGVTYCL